MKTKEEEKTLKSKMESKPEKVEKPKKAEKPEEKPEKTEEKNFDLGASRHIFGKVLLGLLILFLTVFFGKTALWEYYYYNEMEGSERTPAENVESNEVELDETPVTEETRAEHVVPGNHPRYLSIEKLGIKNARVIGMGLTLTGELDTPNNIFDVGWYSSSGKPGGGGTMLIDGHNGGPNIVGVFKYLNELYADDLIVVERGDGYVFTYKVVENKEVPLDESDNYMHVAMTSPIPGEESLTLISCIGEWSQTRGTYLSRQFVRAVLVETKEPE